MAIQQSPVRTSEARQTVLVDTFTDGLLGPEVPMLGPVADGGHVVWNSTPGCWGPMITPSIRGGHEVCQPVAVDGAKAGDAVVIRIKDIEVTFRVRFPEGEGGDAARRILPSLVRRSHEEFCTVSRTVMLGADVTARIE